MATFSEDFESADGPEDKEAVRESTASIIEVEYLKFDLENAEITIRGDKARVFPIELTTIEGSGTLGCTLQKEAGTWRIVSGKMQTPL